MRSTSPPAAHLRPARGPVLPALISPLLTAGAVQRARGYRPTLVGLLPPHQTQQRGHQPTHLVRGSATAGLRKWVKFACLVRTRSSLAQTRLGYRYFPFNVCNLRRSRYLVQSVFCSSFSRVKVYLTLKCRDNAPGFATWVSSPKPARCARPVSPAPDSRKHIILIYNMMCTCVILEVPEM